MAKARANRITRTKRPFQTKGKSLKVWYKLLLFTLFTLVLTALLDTSYSSRQQIFLKIGQPSPNLYKSPIDIEVIDQIATERKRQAAKAQVRPIYIADLQLQSLVLDAISDWQLSDKVKLIVLEAYQRPEGVFESDVSALINQAIQDSPKPDQARRILERDLLATAKEDIQASENAKAAAADAVIPVMTELQAGQTIVREGSFLTATHLEVLQRVGLYTPQGQNLVRTILRFFGSFCIAILLGLGLVYSYPYLKCNLSYKQIIFLATLLLINLSVQRLLFIAQDGILITALTPLLIAVVISPLSALAAGTWLSLVAAFFTPEEAFITLLSSQAAVTTVSLTVGYFHGRASLFLAACLGGIIAVLAFATYSLLAGFESNTLTFGLGIITGGVLTGLLALSILPILENKAGFLTEFKLVELMNPSQPLLQRLLTEAPGTYQHSIIISNLAAQAVGNIGGNELLARVGALYHDIGKLKRPHFFIENQFGRENPHSKLNPHLSYLIITSHVRDGVEMLREYKLPRELEPFVLEHHGNTVLSYFYKKALEENSELEELNFRYVGPRPHSKETAVLMLADTMESASRSLEEPSQSSIRNLIDRLIEQRLQDDQLAESPLNFHDLEIIANTFERVITATLHRRVPYPSEEEIKRLHSSAKSSNLKI